VKWLWIATVVACAAPRPPSPTIVSEPKAKSAEVAKTAETTQARPSSTSMDLLPKIDGLPVWDQPLEKAPSRIRALLASLGAILSDRLTPPSSQDLEVRNAWHKSTFGPWQQRFQVRLRELATSRRSHVQVPEAPMTRLFGFVLRGEINRHLVSQYEVAGLATPPHTQTTPACTTLSVGNVYRDAIAAYDNCAKIAPQAPLQLRSWTARCSKRRQEMQDGLRPFEIYCTADADEDYFEMPHVPDTRN
jgi:hypothetical protein